MNLDELQKLPHKWWKKNQTYIPCKENLIIDYDGETMEFRFSRRELLPSLEALTNITAINDIIPTKFDCCYAINTEIMEYIQARSHTRSHADSTLEAREEAADIAIFTALYLKLYFDFNLHWFASPLHLTNPFGEVYYLEPVFSWTSKDELVQLLKWSVSVAKEQVIKKLQYNEKRDDHVFSRY